MNVQVSWLKAGLSDGERAFRIYRQAKSFGAAAHLLVRESRTELSPGAPSLIAPMVTTSAFAIELLLKAASAASGQSTNRKHKLLELFDGLPTDIQALINAEFGAVAGRRKSLNRTLVMMNDAFADWRYAYESLKRGLVFKPNDAIMLIEAIDNVCRSLLVARGLMQASG